MTNASSWDCGWPTASVRPPLTGSASMVLFAALFVPTGTMGNTIGIKLLTEHGQEVVCDARAHILDYELSMVAWFSGCVVRAVPTTNGILSWDQIRRVIRPLGAHWAQTGAIA